MKEVYITQGNKIYCNGHLIFEAPGQITNYIEYKKSLIFHYFADDKELYKYSEQEIYANVISINLQGQINWRLPVPELADGPKYQPSYQDLGKAETGNFWTSAASYGIKFDPDNGKILEKVFTK